MRTGCSESECCAMCAVANDDDGVVLLALTAGAFASLNVSPPRPPT